MRSIGRMRHRVDVVGPARVSDGALGRTRTDAVLASLWAQVSEASGSEKFRYQHLEQEITHSVKMRQNADVKQGTYLNFGGRKLYIMAVVDPTERGEWMKILCREGGQQ